MNNARFVRGGERAGNLNQQIERRTQSHTA
jgi:hypothetical protein